MRYPVLALVSCCVLAGAATVSADDVVGLDCSQKSLADAVRDVRDDRRTVILFTGICAGPITIKTDGLTIIGVRRRDRAGARYQRDRVPALGSVYDITLKMASR